MAWRHVSLFVLVPLLFAANARAEDKEPTAIVELGPAGEWGLPGPSSYGPSFAVEFTPIKDWLEIEVGAARMFHGGGSEWDTDLLFKKPWTISRKAEFMLGVGPQWVHLRQNEKVTNSFAGEVAGDFMFWPTGKHRFGWFLEPAYDYSFAGGHQQSIGMSAGLLIGIP